MTAPELFALDDLRNSTLRTRSEKKTNKGPSSTLWNKAIGQLNVSRL